MFAWKWTLGSEKRLVCVNYKASQSFSSIVLSDVQETGMGDKVNVTELFSGSVYQRSVQEMRNTGLGVLVDQFSAQIFTYP